MNTRLSVLFFLVLISLTSAFRTPFFITSAEAADRPRLSLGNEFIYGGQASQTKAVGDTIQLMGPTGSGAPYLGDFEAGWNGWTSIDVTKPTTTHWQVSDYNQGVVGNLAAWCGDLNIASCNDSLDAVGGYGNSWHDLLAYRVSVTNPAVSAEVALNATLQYDCEPGYDYTRVSVKTEGNLGYTDIQSWDEQGVVNVDLNFSFLPSELVGGTDVYVLWRFQSDGGWSDQDCLWPTAGACQVDDITITVSQAGEADIVSFTDFQDGTFGDWFVDFISGVGNFAKLWTGLNDLDPCAINTSQQVAFIDDGLVVPGTGGTQCINWCYAESGYVVNWSGGLWSPYGELYIDVNSPVMPIPVASIDGMVFEFDVYRHEDLDADSPGIFYRWSIRSADTDGSHGDVQVIDDQEWQDRNFIYYGGPEYIRVTNVVSDLMNSGSDEVQVQLGIWQFHFPSFIYNDATPAPYFDNVSVKVFSIQGPSMAVETAELAQDNFPEVDTLNYADLASMHVRFDMAANISYTAHMRNDPGDSIIAHIVPGRSGAVLGQTEMHYTIQTNPIFDSFRTIPAVGVVLGIPAVANGVPAPMKWQFDLPDSSSLFPGDVIHYYFRATDDLGGDVQVSTVPADLTGYGQFNGDPLAYDTRFVMHALPTISDDGVGGYQSPEILFWNDQGSGGGEAAWYTSLRSLGYVFGDDFDVYKTLAPASRLGNGLGGRTAGPALAPYQHILYTSGEISSVTISNGDGYYDRGNDIAALMNWMSIGDKDLFLTGDNLVSDLEDSGASGLSFLNSVMGLDLVTGDLKSMIDNQATPLVLAIAGAPVLSQSTSWIAYGGCAAINAFDGVTIRAGATRLAEFAGTDGLGSEYPFSAMTSNVFNGTNQIVSLPYGFRFTTIDPNAVVASAFVGRTLLLEDVLTHFGQVGNGTPTSVLPEVRFATTNFPNPFNPSTEISYTIAAPGHLTVKIYNTRGELVRILLDERVEAGGSIHWRGDNDFGERVSSGVYFYEARMGNEVQVSKMALIK